MDFSDEENDSTSLIEKSDLQVHRQNQHERRKQRFRLTMLCLALAVASSCGTVLTEKLFQWLNRTTHVSGLPIQYDPVGAFIACPDTSSMAAREAGCKFDVLGMGWVPPPCFDQELYTLATEGVLSGAVPDFGYYTPAGEQVSMIEMMQHGEYERYPEVHLSTESHYQHCRYNLNATIRRYATMYDSYMDGMLNVEHMEHCVSVLADDDGKRAKAPHPPYPIIPLGAGFWMPRRCYLKQHFPRGRDVHSDFGYLKKPDSWKLNTPVFELVDGKWSKHSLPNKLPGFLGVNYD